MTLGALARVVVTDRHHLDAPAIHAVVTKACMEREREETIYKLDREASERRRKEAWRTVKLK